MTNQKIFYRLVDQAVNLVQVTDNPHAIIDEAASVCYDRPIKDTEHDQSVFAEQLLKRRHHSVFEHCFATFRIVCDRGITHELVRHRLASYTQSSTRYIDYGSTIPVIMPEYFRTGCTEYARDLWCLGVNQACEDYYMLRQHGVGPQHARSVLPTCTAATIYMTANFREWRHVLTMRTDKAAHPDMRTTAALIAQELEVIMPEYFNGEYHV